MLISINLDDIILSIDIPLLPCAAKNWHRNLTNTVKVLNIETPLEKKDRICPSWKSKLLQCSQ